MKKLKNKKTFLLFLLGFYALVAIFTGTAMYLPYIDAEESSNEEDYSESEEDSDEEEDSGEEESSEDEGEEYMEDDSENTEDEDIDEESMDEEYSDEEEYSDGEDYSDGEEDSDDEEYIDVEDDSEDTEDTTDDIQTEDDINDTAIPHTEDTESDIYVDSVAVPTPIPDNSTEDTSEDFPLAFSYNGTGKLNIRKEPSKTGSIIGTISNNSTGMILEFANDQWAKVTCNNLEGYVAYEYIEYTLPEGTLTPSPTPTVTP